MKIENVLVRAKPHYCVPAILETTFKYFGIDNFTQDDIAQYFTIHIPSTSDQNLPNVVIDDNPRNWGIKLDISSLNNFFQKISVPLKEEYNSIFRMADEFGLEDKLDNILQKGHVAICGYNHSALYGNNKDEYGHVSIVVSLNCTTHKVLLADPGPVGYGLKEV